MRRVINRLVGVLFAVTAVLFVAFVLWDAFQQKNTPPQIVCSADVVTASIADGDEALLRGVTATDAEDGDLTAQVMVESISRFVSNGVCRITYTVQDSHNAVTKLTRTLAYTDYTSPRFSLTAPLVFDYGKSFDPTKFVTAADCLDGDLTESVRMTLMEDSPTITGVGKWKVQFRVTNSMGETAYLTTNVTVQDLSTSEKRYTPNILLKNYIVYIPQGSAFDPTAYVDGVTIAAEDANDNAAQLRARLRNSSAVDTATPGVYTVTYTCTATNGYSGSVDLIVVVEGASA